MVPIQKILIPICEFSITLLEQLWGTCVCLAGPGPERAQTVQEGPSGDRDGPWVTVPSSVTPEAVRGGWARMEGVGKVPLEGTHHVDHGGQLVEDGLAREVQHADQACRGEGGVGGHRVSPQPWGRLTDPGQ